MMERLPHPELGQNGESPSKKVPSSTEFTMGSYRKPEEGPSFSNRFIAGAFVLLVGLNGDLVANESPALFPKDVQQVLTTYCYDCHGDGMEKGKVAFDAFTSRQD